MKNLNRDKSTEQAVIIETIKPFLYNLDTKYLREAAKGMIENANRQDSMAVMIPGYDPDKPNIVREKASALISLCDFKDKLVKAAEMEKEFKNTESIRDQIKNQFL